MVTLLILFDFSKAFDLITVFCCANFPAFGYLILSLNDTESIWQIALNVMMSLRHYNHIFYADNLQIYLHFLSAELGVVLALIREAVAQWVSDNSLTLNASKTKVILFWNTRFVNNIQANSNIELFLNDIPIKLSNQAINFGSYEHSQLVWARQESFPQGEWSLVAIEIHKHNFFILLCVRLMSSLIFPFFDYCSAVFTDLTGQQRLRIRKTNACILSSTCVMMIAYLASTMSLGWLPSDDRRDYLTGCLIYSILNTSIPSYLADGLRVCSRLHATSRIYPLDFVISNCKTTIYQYLHTRPHSGILRIGLEFSGAIKVTESLTSFRHANFCHLRRRVMWEFRVSWIL